MNRIEVRAFLKSFFLKLKDPQGGKKADIKPFLDLVLSFRGDLPLSIPILRDLGAVKTGRESILIKGKIDRLYRRLCRLQEELGRLDLKKAASGTALEDFVFSQIDFFRYRNIEKSVFEGFYSQGLNDFGNAFFYKNFGFTGEEIKSLIESSYVSAEGIYELRKESPLILSVMRTLETNLDTLPLFTAPEIERELNDICAFVMGEGKGSLRGSEGLFPLLAASLDGLQVIHIDGMATRLFIGSRLDLEGTFRPGGKPWTRVLIPEAGSLK